MILRIASVTIVFIVLHLSLAVSLGSAADIAAAAPSTALPAAAPVVAACASVAKDLSVWEKSLTGGFSYTNGNSNTSNIDLSGLLARDYQKNSWRFDANYNFGESAAEPDEPREENKNSLRSSAEYRRTFSEVWFAGMGASVLHDEVADLRYRVVLSPGLGRYLIRNDDGKLSIEAGPAYVFEREGDEENTYGAPRIADRFEWKLSETAKIFQSAELLVNVDQSEDYIVNAEVGIEAAITSMFNLVLLVRNAYDNIPATGRERNDVAIVSGLKVNL